MNPTRKRRLGLLLVLLAAIAVAGTLVIVALQHNVRYLLTPSDVAAGQAQAGRVFRLGGVVCEGSIARTPDTLDVRFIVTDRIHQIPVRYHGILPDLFRAGQSIIATGTLKPDGFHADEVLAKHDETYMPKEVEEAIAKGKALPHTACAPPPAASALPPPGEGGATAPDEGRR
ncbi:MAG: cytochrome c maturation protein CcmE [Proteobacteria bacterium]|nr:cytochrome c maturation protein CcmE [Pseudomonadota bacterium]MBS0463556.1 cytochrome c maturation protein CcmE [Pseudomonadota bacterium]